MNHAINNAESIASIIRDENHGLLDMVTNFAKASAADCIEFAQVTATNNQLSAEL